MHRIKRFFSLITILITFNFFISQFHNVKAVVSDESIQSLKEEIDKLKETISKLQIRLHYLEPKTPQTIQTERFEQIPYPSKINEIKTIMIQENIIPFQTIINRPEYIRPIYHKDWHSTIGRWSSIPSNIRTAQHRLFTNYDIGLSNWYDFIHQMGFEIPMFQSEKELDLYIVTFNTEVTNIYTKGNQIIITGIPKRNGVQVNTITTKDLKPFNKHEFLLIQLVTPDGYEIDYTLESYVEPDYWTTIKDR